MSGLVKRKRKEKGRSGIGLKVDQAGSIWPKKHRLRLGGHTGRLGLRLRSVTCGPARLRNTARRPARQIGPAAHSSSSLFFSSFLLLLLLARGSRSAAWSSSDEGPLAVTTATAEPKRGKRRRKTGQGWGRRGFAHTRTGSWDTRSATWPWQGDGEPKGGGGGFMWACAVMGHPFSWCLGVPSLRRRGQSEAVGRRSRVWTK